MITNVYLTMFHCLVIKSLFFIFIFCLAYYLVSYGVRLIVN